MKIALRILVGLVAVIVMISGVHKVMEGLGYIKPAEKVGQRYTDTTNGCSYLLPEGWEKKADDGGIVKVKFKGQRGRNLSVFSEAFPGTLRQYVDANIDVLKKQFPAASVASDTKFTTDKGAEAVELIFANKAGDENIRQMMHFYDGNGGKKILFTATVAESDVPATEPVLEACAKSLELTP